MSESFLSTAGSLFFAVWALIVGALGAAVFGPDLLPARKPIEPLRDKRLADLLPPATQRLR